MRGYSDIVCRVGRKHLKLTSTQEIVMCLNAPEFFEKTNSIFISFDDGSDFTEGPKLCFLTILKINAVAPPFLFPRRGNTLSATGSNFIPSLDVVYAFKVHELDCSPCVDFQKVKSACV